MNKSSSVNVYFNTRFYVVIFIKKLISNQVSSTLWAVRLFLVLKLRFYEEKLYWLLSLYISTAVLTAPPPGNALIISIIIARSLILFYYFYLPRCCGLCYLSCLSYHCFEHIRRNYVNDVLNACPCETHIVWCSSIKTKRQRGIRTF